MPIRTQPAPVAAEAIEADDRCIHDPATGLPNRSFLATFLAYAMAQADRRHEPISLLYIGADRIGAIRELLGEAAATEAVRAIGRTIARTLRSSDLVARLDDGRLAAVLPGAAADDARMIAETIRAAIEATGIATASRPLLTASIGVATSPGDADDPDSLRSAADDALAIARERGRNRVAFALPVATPITARRIAEFVG